MENKAQAKACSVLGFHVRGAALVRAGSSVGRAFDFQWEPSQETGCGTGLKFGERSGYTPWVSRANTERSHRKMERVET